jgi:biotin carboxyl carrier protein
MKKYRVKVNGKVYEVELEEVTKKEGSISINENDVNVSKDSGTKIISFMQGVIVDLKVAEGQTVIEGQTLALLEAMKMENQIVSPVDGTVSKIYIAKNDVVENQEVLMIIK